MRSLKKVLALMLSLAMVFGTLTVTAFADIEWTEVTTTAELKAAITAAEEGVTKYIKVTKRIGMTSSAYVTIPEKRDIVIDVNGHSLGLSNKTINIAPITNNGTLTLQDSVGGGNVWGNSSGASAYPIINNGTLTIKDGVAVARYSGTVTNTEEDISKIGTLYAATAVKKECIKNAGTLTIENATLCNGVTTDGSITIQLGNFATDLSANVEEGFEWQEGSTAFGCAYKSVKVSNAEALIGTTEYATLAEAFAAAVDGNTILLNKDVTVTNRIELADAAEDAKKTINFNMNGKKITYTGESNGFLLVRAYDTVNIYGEGTVDIQAGDFFFATNHYAKVNIEDGTFTGGKRLAYTSYGSSTMNISGGIWSIDPSNQMSTAETPVAYSGLAKNFIAVAQGTDPETWLIMPEPVVRVDVAGKTTEYASFDEGFLAAFKSGKAATITVLKDTTSDGNIDTTGSESTAGVVLDLNGKTVSVTGTKFMKLYKSALTITDESAEGNGKLLGTADSIASDGFIYANSSNAIITVEGGTIEANGEKAILRTGGSNTAGIVVNGGTIINKNETDPYTVVCATSSSYTPSVSINGGSFEGAMTVGSAGAFTISGGTFNFNPEELYDQGETVIINGDVNDNEDGTWTVIPQMVATLFANGEEVANYPTVDQALKEGYKAYTDGDSITVSLLGDVVSGGNMDLSTKAVKDEVSGSWTYNAPDITLDLNNHQLIVTGAQFLKLKAKFTIDDFSEDKGGILEATTSSVSSTGIFYLNGGRSFNVNNGTVSATNLTDSQYLIDASGFQTPININGGTLDAGTDGAFAIRTNNNGSVTTISGGTILSPVQFDAGSGRATGGSFAADPTEWGITVEGIYIVDGPDDQDLYNVIIDPDADYIVSYNGTEYQTVAGAVADILATPTKTGTITFITDAMIREGVINVEDEDAHITFDLNEHFIQEDSVSQLFLLEKGDFTIKNGDIYASGQIATSGHIRANGAKLLVQNIIFDGDKLGGDTVTNINSKNGGAFYIYGSSVTFDKTTIKNCKVKDEAGGTGNSGAIHIVKQNVTTLSNVYFINGSKIENCEAAVQGGAVSVGSGCTFHMDNTTYISNCKAQLGGAIYVDIADSSNFPAQTDFLCGKVVIDNLIASQIVECTSTGDQSAPIVSNGLVREGVGQTVITEGGVYQRQTVAMFDDISVDLYSNLDVNIGFYLAIKTGGESGDIKARVAIEGEEESYIEIEDPHSGYNVVEIEALPLSMMANKIEAQIGNGEGTFYSNSWDTSVVEYAQLAYFEDPENAELAALLADMLKLGSEVQKYWTGTPGVAFDVADTCLAEFVTDRAISAADSIKKTTVSASDPSNYKFTEASLNVLDKICPFFFVYSTDTSVKVVVKFEGQIIDEKLISELDPVPGQANTYRYNLPGKLGPIDYKCGLTVSLEKADGTVLHEATYSIYSYCYAMKDSEIADLAIAIFRAGKSAEAYMGKSPA